MSAPPRADDLGRFLDTIARQLGLHFEDDRSGFLAGVLRRRQEAYGGPREGYLGRLIAGALPAETAALAEELTVNETYFFRNVEQFDAFRDLVVTGRRTGPGPRASSPLRILSVGCASGEEPYTLAILVDELARQPYRDVEIVGVDIDPDALASARGGRYSPWALRAIPDDVRERWFHRDGSQFVLDQAIRGRVRFLERNLVEEDPMLWTPGAYEVIFCRNVLMYFTPDTYRAVLRRLVDSLAPGGYLFLGHAETLVGRPGVTGPTVEVAVRHTHGTFYYQRMPTGAPPAIAYRSPATIELAAPAGWEAALDLLRGERFGDALRTVEALPGPATDDALILRAVP
jgi:chemotaxis protein methyltransferase CheR